MDGDNGQGVIVPEPEHLRRFSTKLHLRKAGVISWTRIHKGLSLGSGLSLQYKSIKYKPCQYVCSSHIKLVFHLVQGWIRIFYSRILMKANL